MQCVNALFAMVADAERIKLAFGGAVDIAEVLPIEEGRFLTFEYIGPTDYFGEGSAVARTSDGDGAPTAPASTPPSSTRPQPV